MSTYTVFDLEAIKNAVHNGGAAGLTEYITDDVELTHADERSYTEQAQAQRAKGFEEIDVRFEQPPN